MSKRTFAGGCNVRREIPVVRIMRRPASFAALGALVMLAFLFAIARPESVAHAQAGAPTTAPARPAAHPAARNDGPRPVMAEDVFKNIQVLKGVPVPEFMEAMGFFSGSLNESCEYCHAMVKGTWDEYAADTEHKKTARKMVLMVRAINREHFGGTRAVTCYSCHHGDDRPKLAPTLAGVYSSPPPEDPDDVPLGPAPKTVTADQVLDKYIQALGGSQKLAAIASFVAKGKSVGYGDEAYDRPVDIFAKAPGMRSQIIHTRTGDNTTTYDGRAAWVAAPITAAPVPVVALTKADLGAAKFDASLAFPGGIKQALGAWRIGSPATIDDRPVQVLQGTASGGYPVRLFFDSNSGLLVRQLRFTDSPVGSIPTQVDYSDYRDVTGVKMPFHWTLTWLDGKATFDLSEVRPNVPVDAAKFARPAPPTPPKAAGQ